MEGATVVTSAAWETVISAIAAQISVATIVEVLAAVVGVSIGFVFMWWGVRKVSRALINSAKSGKLRF